MRDVDRSAYLTAPIPACSAIRSSSSPPRSWAFSVTAARAQHRWAHDHLVDGHVELHASRLRGAPWPRVVDASLGRRLVGAQPQARRGREVDARFRGDPRKRAEQERLHVVRAERSAWQDSEVQAFGEAVCLDVALLEAGASLEHPGLREDRIGADPPQQPSENVVLLDDLLRETPLADPVRSRQLG